MRSSVNISYFFYPTIDIKKNTEGIRPNAHMTRFTSRINNGSRSNRPQVKSAPCYIHVHVYKIKLKYRYLTLFFLPNATGTCLLEKQKYQFLQSLVWHTKCIISYWKNDTLFVPSGILSSWSAVLSGQIDVPYILHVYKPFAMMNFRECFKVNF